MRIFNGIQEVHFHHSVITIGNFDGLHKGHQELIKYVCELARSLDQPSVLITYSPHPLMVLNSKKEISLLLNFKDWVLKLKALGLDILVIENFTSALSQKEPEEYLKESLLKPLSPSVIVVGENFRFGKERKGTTLLLKEWEKKYQYKLEKFPLFKLDQQVVSSTRVRDYLKVGNLEKISYLLGRRYFLRGKIIPGEKRGRILGYPTLNIEVKDQLIPPYGVYVSSASIEVDQGKKKGTLRSLRSVTNIGYNPTFNGKKEEKKVKIETHIFDDRVKNLGLLHFNDEIYGLDLILSFYQFLRSEKKFETQERLRKQIKVDIQEAKNFKW